MKHKYVIIFPPKIKPIPPKFNGIKTVGNVFGKQEKVYLPRKTNKI